MHACCPCRSKWKGKGKKRKSKRAAEEDEDLYALLGLQHERWLATPDGIKAAYRKSALLFHPDKQASGASIPPPQPRSRTQPHSRSPGRAAGRRGRRHAAAPLRPGMSHRSAARCWDPLLSLQGTGLDDEERQRVEDKFKRVQVGWAAALLPPCAG